MCGRACDNSRVDELQGLSLSVCVCLHMCEIKGVYFVFLCMRVCLYVCYTVKSNDCRQNLRGFDGHLCDYARLCVCAHVSSVSG